MAGNREQHPIDRSMNSWMTGRSGPPQGYTSMDRQRGVGDYFRRKRGPSFEEIIDWLTKAYDAVIPGFSEGVQKLGNRIFGEPK